MGLLKLKRITLPNRDGASLYFLETERKSNLYKLVCSQSHRYVLEYATITMCEDNRTIFAFDPSGGPFLCLGYKLGDKEIKAILELDGEIVFMIR